ncbi:hypothetical protein TNCV_3641591 [Trichonephila clavipes]|nr:hypothetical protein TNCV_3641591 [Trichonephila clavipes]
MALDTVDGINNREQIVYHIEPFGWDFLVPVIDCGQNELVVAPSCFRDYPSLHALDIKPEETFVCSGNKLPATD